MDTASWQRAREAVVAAALPHIPFDGWTERACLREAAAKGAELAVLEVPLLLETGGEARVDVVIVVSAPPDAQRERVLARPGMTVEKFERILGLQVPDAQKRALADYVIDTGTTLAETRHQVAALVHRLMSASGEKAALRPL